MYVKSLVYFVELLDFGVAALVVVFLIDTIIRSSVRVEELMLRTLEVASLYMADSIPLASACTLEMSASGNADL